MDGVAAGQSRLEGEVEDGLSALELGLTAAEHRLKGGRLLGQHGCEGGGSGQRVRQAL